jgi:hypothetical protein
MWYKFRWIFLKSVFKCMIAHCCLPKSSYLIHIIVDFPTRNISIWIPRSHVLQVRLIYSTSIVSHEHLPFGAGFPTCLLIYMKICGMVRLRSALTLTLKFQYTFKFRKQRCEKVPIRFTYDENFHSINSTLQLCSLVKLSAIPVPLWSITDSLSVHQ